MTIHEFGKENKETIILIHPSVVKWDYFENVNSSVRKELSSAGSGTSGL